MDKILPSHPESYKNLLKHSIRLYYVSFTKVILLAFFLSIIVFIPRFLSDIVEQDLFLHLSPFHLYRFYLVLIDLAGLIFFIAIIWRMNCIIRDIHEPLIQDFSVGIRKVFYVFVATVLQSAIIFAVAMIILGLLLLYHAHFLFARHIAGSIITTCIFIGQLILILYVGTLFYFFIPLIALENKGILTSLERSVSLVWNHWWRVFSLQLTPWICYVVLLIIMKRGLDINIHIYFVEHSVHSVNTTCLNVVIFALFIPWAAAIL